MKRPLLNREERFIAASDTHSGALYQLQLAGIRFKRDVGCVRWNLYWRWVKIATVKYKNK